MNTIRTLGFAAIAALSLGAGAGAAMAQEGANDTISGSTYFGARTVQMQSGQQGVVSSGSSDVEVRPAANAQWQPGTANEASQD